MSLQSLFNNADDYKNKLQSSHPLTPQEQTSLDQYSRNIFTNSCDTCSCAQSIGYGAAFDYMIDIARQDDLQITEDIIKHLHTLLCQTVDVNSSGKYRDTPVELSADSYIPPAPADIAHFMEHFINQIVSSIRLLHPIELAAMCYKRLMDIQPFAEDNEPIALLLMNLYLVNNGYGVVTIPPALRDDYLNSLTLSRSAQNTDPFVKLIAECVIATEQEYYKILKLG